ncbi:MAG: nucleoside-diphosphate kinase [Sedimentisphaerales bacterium]|nr:nucleoside-diphosphate kinase [Sedimentisphaerales bacterium]
MIMDPKQLEQTLVLIKPDALKNSITGFIFSQLSEFHTGARYAAAKIVNVNRFLAEEHYAEHKGKAFYEPLLDYITGAIHYPEQDKWKRRVIAIVYQGPGVLDTVRAIAGPTNPHEAREEKPGCIRALGTVVPIKDANGNIIGHRMDNLVHASATSADAEREIKLWFLPQDIPPLMRAYPTEICSTHYYYKDGRLCETYEPNSLFLLAPGDEAWKTDLDILQDFARNEPAQGRLSTVVAKYLINRNV